jgi:hypothetical protein
MSLLPWPVVASCERDTAFGWVAANVVAAGGAVAAAVAGQVWCFGIVAGVCLAIRKTENDIAALAEDHDRHDLVPPRLRDM